MPSFRLQLLAELSLWPSKMRTMPMLEGVRWLAYVALLTLVEASDHPDGKGKGKGEGDGGGYDHDGQHGKHHGDTADDEEEGDQMGMRLTRLIIPICITVAITTCVVSRPHASRTRACFKEAELDTNEPKAKPPPIF